MTSQRNEAYLMFTSPSDRPNDAPGPLSNPGARFGLALSFTDSHVIERVDCLSAVTCTCAGGAFIMPSMSGAVTVNAAATTNNTLAPKLSFRPTEAAIMRSTLCFRFAPPTPAAHGNGDPRYNRQTCRIASAYTSGSVPVCNTASSQARS